MNIIARRLGPATRGTAIFHGRPHHVNALQYRTAFKCIHSGPKGETEGTLSGNEASSSKPGGNTNGLGGEGLFGSKSEESREKGIHQASQTFSSHQEEHAASDPGNHQSIYKRKAPSDKDRAKPLVQPVEAASVIRKIYLRHDMTDHNFAPGQASLPARETTVKEKWVRKSKSMQKKIIQRSSTIEYDFPEQAVCYISNTQMFSEFANTL